MKRINKLPQKILFTVFYLALLFGLYKLGASCIFLNILHIPCPGCGMMRAVNSAVQFDFVSAFRYHSAFWTLPLLYLYFLFDGNLFKSKKINTAVFTVIVICFGINWIYHIFYPL